MPTARVGPKHQITIPKEAFEKLGLSPGDILDVQVRDDLLYLVPLNLIPRDQAWFWTPEWQAMEREASENIARGDVSEAFDTAEELFTHLRNPRT